MKYLVVIFEQQTTNICKKKERKKREKRQEQKESLPGVGTRVLKLKVAPTLYLDRRPVVFFIRKKASHYTAHARVTHGTRHAARQNLDDNVPQTCSSTVNPELWQAVPFSKR